MVVALMLGAKWPSSLSVASAMIDFAVARKVDTLVMGSHGYRLLGDLLWGETVDPVCHRVGIPVWWSAKSVRLDFLISEIFYSHLIVLWIFRHRGS